MSDLITPHSSSRTRKLLPVPLCPKMPLLRSTSRSRLMVMGMSMVSGVPMAKCFSSSPPNTVAKSVSVAARRSAKCMGIVRTGWGGERSMVKVSSSPFSIISIGRTWTVT